MRRFRVRTLMIVVAVIAVLLASVEPVRRVYRRWSYHRSQVARYRLLEGIEYSNNDRERKAAIDREAMASELMKTPLFVDKNPAAREKVISAMVRYHEQLAEQSLNSARRWARDRRDSETAMWWCWDPFAPDAP